MLTPAYRARVFKAKFSPYWVVILMSPRGGVDSELYYRWADAIAMARGWVSRKC